MKNQLQARGKMFGLAFKSITKAEFKELMKTGRTGALYESLKEANNNEEAHYGFYQLEGKPSFDLYLLVQTKESQAELLLNHTTGKIKAEIYNLALIRSNEEIHNLEVKIANLQLQLKGGNESKKWVNWLRDFGQSLDRKKELSDEEKKQYLTGLIEVIKVKYDEKKNQHELSIQFQLPIVGDGIQWKNQANKKEGYKIKKGKQVTSVTVQKKDPRWSKTSSKVTPQRKQSVTVE